MHALHSNIDAKAYAASVGRPREVTRRQAVKFFGRHRVIRLPCCSKTTATT
jgi:hypothetical protein